MCATSLCVEDTCCIGLVVSDSVRAVSGCSDGHRELGSKLRDTVVGASSACEVGGCRIDPVGGIGPTDSGCTAVVNTKAGDDTSVVTCVVVFEGLVLVRIVIFGLYVRVFRVWGVYGWGWWGSSAVVL